MRKANKSMSNRAEEFIDFSPTLTHMRLLKNLLFAQEILFLKMFAKEIFFLAGSFFLSLRSRWEKETFRVLIAA